MQPAPDHCAQLCCGRRVTLVYVVLLLIYPGTNIVFKKLEKLLVVSAMHWPLNSNYHTKTSKIILYLSVSVPFVFT